VERLIAVQLAITHGPAHPMHCTASGDDAAGIYRASGSWSLVVSLFQVTWVKIPSHAVLGGPPGTDPAPRRRRLDGFLAMAAGLDRQIFRVARHSVVVPNNRHHWRTYRHVPANLFDDPENS